ncbi:MAG TPA: xanthine dehydrogenase family protein subunit M [Gammaproteobacteria bacterium]|jgi:CO/xanthine dehydrogenase FAD-binding subunit|nr:medium FAD-binding subunit of molybdenum enzyme [Acidiferrobacteraceae bacterium]MDP6551579.1 FAD binding domain-containing protein [Arenicellales bacterium]HCX86469.1 xanthine dehydrogenase family protein subunit M [Gammaproteobacteria bacterium]|tara:strand:+ start:255 stop:1127 length:873 start_codon:yes stop_codon:yes gene_type:complete
MYAEYDLDIPDSLEAALAILADGGVGNIQPLAGGTNLLIDIRAKTIRPERVVGLDRIDELRGIKADAGRVSVGSRTTVSDLLHSDLIAAEAPSLFESARRFAGQMVRNAATIGGNIACGSPAADLVPPLLSLDAEITLSGSAGSRNVALRDYFLGYKQDVRRADELVTRIRWDRLPGNTVNTFYKLARRQGDAITITGVALTLIVADGRCETARIALGSVSPTPIRAGGAEAMLTGETLTPELIEEAAARAAAECSPIDDVRASAAYRRHTVETLTRRLLLQAWNKLARG